MTDQDVFDNKPKEENTEGSDPTKSSNDLFADKLKVIVNDKGEPKYKDVESALEALGHSQQFIETLKNEKRSTEEKLIELQAELEKRKSVEDTIKELTQSKPQEEKADPPSNVQQGFDEEKAQKIFESLLSKREREAMKEANRREVSNSLFQKYGDKASSVLESKVKELGMTMEDFKELSENRPKVVLSLFKDTMTSTSPSSSNLRSTFSEPKLETPKFEKSLMRGGRTTKEVADAFSQIKQYTHKRIGVEN